MSTKNCRSIRPLNLRDAFDKCVKSGQKKYNRSIDSIAEIMGVKKWTLYKWIDDTDMPIHLIKSFENACGANYVSRWLVESNGQIVVDIPIGKKCGPKDIQALQIAYNEATGKLLEFYAELTGVDETLAAIQTSLEQTTWHRSNVQKFQQPEIPFEED